MSSSYPLKPVVHAPGAGQTVGAMGVALTFKTVGTDSDGQWLILEYMAPPQLSGPPPQPNIFSSLPRPGWKITSLK